MVKTTAMGELAHQESNVSHSVSTADISEFLSAHPITANNPSPLPFGATGELTALNPESPIEVRSLITLARSCDEVLAAPIDEVRKRAICEAKVNTVIRLQNPDLATEECLVYEKADQLHYDFEEKQALMLRARTATLDQLSAMPDPADQLRADFLTYVSSAYNLPALQGRAQATLLPFIDDWHKAEFERVIEFHRADDPARITAFGASATAHVVTIL